MFCPPHYEPQDFLPSLLAKLIAAPIVLGFLFHVNVTLAAAPQEPPQVSSQQKVPEPIPLVPGKPLERDMQAREKHFYYIRLESGQFFHAEVEQLGIDVYLILFAPDSKPIASMNSPNGDFGPEKISTIAQAPGIYILEVESNDEPVPAGRYRVTVEPPRTPSDADRGRITAERTFYEAALLQGQGTADSYRSALQKFLATLPLWHAAGDGYEEALTQESIGNIHSAFGEHLKALDYFAQALQLRRAVGDRAGEAATLNNMGYANDALGQLQKALDFYNQSLPLERALGNRSGEAVTLNNIGTIYGALGQLQKALDYFNQALPLRRAMGDRSGEAAALNNIARIYKDLGEKQKALEYFNLALPLERAVADRAEEGATLNNIGSVYDDLGDKQNALNYYSQALPIRRAAGDRYGEAVTLSNIGSIHSQSGDHQQALDDFNQSLALFRTVRDPLGQAQVLSNLMSAWRDQKQPEAAIFFGKLAVNEIQQVRSNIRGMEKEAQHSFLGSKEKTYRELADILISQGRLPEAQQVLDLLKNEEYFEFIRRDGRQAASLTAPLPLTKKEEELSRQYDANASSVTAIANERAALLSKPSRTPEEDQHLTELAAQLKQANQAWSKFLDDLHTELAKSTQPQTTVQSLQENASALQKVVRQLSPGTVALYTLVGEEKFHIILVTPTVQLAREFPIKSAGLNKKIAAFRDALLDPTSDPVPQAQELYKILIGPVAKDLDGAQATTLMWSLDGVLRYIPLAALHDGHAYLLEKYRNIVFTPASVPELAARPAVTEWRGLAMGVSKSYGGMSTLPAVPAELRAIIREAGTSESVGVMTGHTMLDDNFTEDNLKHSLLQKYPLIHIASHFVFGPGDDTTSYLLLGGKQSQGQRLTLAEINDDPDISFNDVELLTLSACNTALTIPGDGREVDGLGILAQRKGAKAVMATLWSVYDPSTSLLMQTFYRNWTTGSPTSKAEALRRAQLTLLHGAAPAPTQDHAAPNPPSYSHPYYWAPFILIGNWQ